MQIVLIKICIIMLKSYFTFYIFNGILTKINVQTNFQYYEIIVSFMFLSIVVIIKYQNTDFIPLSQRVLISNNCRTIVHLLNKKIAFITKFSETSKKGAYFSSKLVEIFSSYLYICGKKKTF